MSARLEIMFAKDFNILSQIVWTKPNGPGFDGWKKKVKKDALRRWYPSTERIIFAEPRDEDLRRSPFSHFIRHARKASGISSNRLSGEIGSYGRVNHGGAVSNWETGRNIPSRDQYNKIRDVLFATGKIDPMPTYEYVMEQYVEVSRPFKVDASKEFTDIWTFPSVRPHKGKHPAEKPSAMLEHAIDATTLPGDIVLDCFSGSGSTALAAIKLGRRSISMEIDPIWTSVISDRLLNIKPA